MTARRGVNRTFVYGSPLSVQQPASQAKVQLVERLEPQHWKACGAVMMPLRCDTAWTQKTPALVTGLMAMPPHHADAVGKLVFRIVGTDGQVLGDFEGRVESFGGDGKFARARGRPGLPIWPCPASTFSSVSLTTSRAGSWPASRRGWSACKTRKAIKSRTEDRRGAPSPFPRPKRLLFARPLGEEADPKHQDRGH